ncbi:ATP-NAD kinase-like domain-containing protein [Mycena rebaudengoi]|nr:ATP-NAD kinase-like domain-containing protein [Mycena rebaudengoi]
MSQLNGVAHMSDEGELAIYQDGKPVTLTFVEDGIQVITQQKRTQIETVPYLNVLSATVSHTPDGRSLFDLSYLSATSKTLQLRHIMGDVSAVSQDSSMVKWVAELQNKAYKDITPRRRFLVVVNPHGGQGKAKKLWKDIIEPIFTAAGCHVDLQYTGPISSPTNATAIARNVDLLAYDAIVSVSGDGIANELLNGLASRPDALSALRIPIAPIAAGSGNALAVNVMGPEKVLDLGQCPFLYSGRPIPLDICSVSQGDRRIYSFLSQAFGLMADLDMGTEWIRWVGGIRFILGYLYGILTGCRYNVEITLKVAEGDKRAMVNEYNSHRQQLEPAPESRDIGGDLQMPPLSFGTTDSPFPLGVIHDKLEGAINTRLAHHGAPSTKSDGLIDVILVPPRSAIDSIKGMDGQEEGRFINSPECYYYKVEAYRCTPLEPSGYISIDGESIPHKVFQVENHARLARIMSMDTRWKGLERIVLA